MKMLKPDAELKFLLKATGVRGCDLAAILGVSEPRIIQALQGLNTLSIDMLARAKDYLRARLPGAEKKILEPRTDIARRCRDLGHSIQDLADLIDDRDNPFCCAVVVGLREPPCGFDTAVRNVFKIWTAERGDQVPATGAGEGGA